MESWLSLTFISLVLYGLWAFLPKVAVTHINPMSALVYEIGGTLLVGVVALFLSGFKPQFHPKGVAAALFTGIAGILGTLFFFYALTKGKVSLTVCITALYPLVTLGLAAIFLNEPISPRQFAGMGFAMVAIFLMAG